jgi:hypothetical protein
MQVVIQPTPDLLLLGSNQHGLLVMRTFPYPFIGGGIMVLKTLASGTASTTPDWNFTTSPRTGTRLGSGRDALPMQLVQRVQLGLDPVVLPLVKRKLDAIRGVVRSMWVV